MSEKEKDCLALIAQTIPKMDATEKTAFAAFLEGIAFATGLKPILSKKAENDNCQQTDP